MSGLNPRHLGYAPSDQGGAPEPRASRRVLLLSAGHTGRVGGALQKLLAAERARLLAEARVEFHTVCAVNRREQRWSEPASPWRTDSTPRRAGDWPALLQRFAGFTGPKLFVDCTASPEVAALYPELFRHGIGVVTANKLGNSGTQRDYLALREAAAQHRVPYRYETTAGAALPLLSPLADLRDSGDRLLRIEAVLSGTLSFLFERLNQGAAFSAAVREARDLGYAEPHPAEDLKAADSARKLLVLIRESGIPWEPEQVTVRGLLPPGLEAQTDPERFLEKLAAHDGEWARRAATARERGLRLACLAEFDGRHAHIGLTQVAAADPAARLAAGENLVRVWTRRYRPVPLSIAGPGAGTEVTAAGLLTDLIKAATIAERR
ncbi:MAG: aspartate kinase [Bacillota bacterium]